ncbi:MAG: hypothetical protein OXP74_03835, partial [Acidobacteriota bacterium]|nr:hypothetical protein [Acidobacteriota bacterium]
GPGSLIKLVGIEGTEEFRAAVLAQRERVGGAGGGSAALAPATAAEGEASVESAKLLSEIRDSLLRIEKRLGDDGGG